VAGKQLSPVVLRKSLGGSPAGDEDHELPIVRYKLNPRWHKLQSFFKIRNKNTRNFISRPMHGEKTTDTLAAAIVPEEMEGSSS
jgi:hypothetical protein